MPTPDLSSSEDALAFSVDTHLLRELGALLVGRDSTALVELIKNAYDADASSIVIHGESLAEHGLITVRDDGHGMTYSDFSDKFLRIAGRSKEGGTRQSPRYKRKYTGAKGIGRLSAHKLGERLALESTPDVTVLGRDADESGVVASIDWTQIEQSTESIDQTKLIRATPVAAAEGALGTELTISRLHSDWSTRQLNEFLAEVRSTRPDTTMWRPLPKVNFADPQLLPEILIADTGEDDPGFTIELSGEFGGSDSQWPTLLSHIAWLIEIDARSADEVIYRITPSRQLKTTEPDAEQREFIWARDIDGPRFVSRILVRGNSTFPRELKDTLTTFARSASGIRLFFEGFRVLPYGASRNDWLGLDRGYSARAELTLISDFDDDLSRPNEDVANERTYRLSNQSYFGAVFLHDATSQGLQMVVNREGFLPTEGFDQISDIVTRGINLNTRMRAAIGAGRNERIKAVKAADRTARLKVLLDSTTDKNLPSKPSTPAQELKTLLELGRESAAALRSSTPTSNDPIALKEHATVVQAVLDELGAVSTAAADEQAQLRVLASLGTQLGAFVHEVNSLLGQARSIESALKGLLDLDLAESVRQQLQRVLRAQTELLTTLERQSVYLSDSFGAESRRRRSRQKVSERWATAHRLLASSASRRNVQILDAVPSDLRTPPMFAAELNIVLTNLLSNAVKAAAADRTQASRVVQVSGHRRDGRVFLRVENTGARVDLDDSERWFRPFETTTSEMDEALGQGLGLGLTLTRRIIEDYGGQISFVTPTPGMATTVEIWLPEN